MSPKQSLQKQFGYTPPCKLPRSSCFDASSSSTTKCSAPLVTAEPVGNTSADQWIAYDDDNFDELVQFTDEYAEIDSNFFNLSDDEFVMDPGRLVPATKQPRSVKSHLSCSDSRTADCPSTGSPHARVELVPECSIEDITLSTHHDQTKLSTSSVSSYQVTALQTSQLPVPIQLQSPFYGSWGQHYKRRSPCQSNEQPLRGIATIHTDGAPLNVSLSPAFHIAGQRTSSTVSQIDKSSSVPPQTVHNADSHAATASFFAAGPVKWVVHALKVWEKMNLIYILCKIFITTSVLENSKSMKRE